MHHSDRVIGYTRWNNGITIIVTRVMLIKKKIACSNHRIAYLKYILGKRIDWFLCCWIISNYCKNLMDDPISLIMYICGCRFYCSVLSPIIFLIHSLLCFFCICIIWPSTVCIIYHCQYYVKVTKLGVWIISSHFLIYCM